jgi:hypothetical protein
MEFPALNILESTREVSVRNVDDSSIPSLVKIANAAYAVAAHGQPGVSSPISATVDRADTDLDQPMAAVVPTRWSAGADRSGTRDSLDALGMQLCFSVSYLSATAPEIVFAQILTECGLELSTRDDGLLNPDVVAEIAIAFGLAVVLDGMPPTGSILAILADLAAPFAVTVSVPATHRLRVA